MLCPKCHQPIEGDEQYVCCAGATLQWRCTGCAKVSEGFAFPYGMCPHCGGKLERTEARELGGDGQVAAIRAAFEIELGGQAFYEQAASQADDDDLKILFGKMAAMELEHIQTLKQRYHAEVPPRPDIFPLSLAAGYSGLADRPDDPANLFRLAIAFENRAIAFFAERGAQAPEGSAEQQLYRELAAEEREHAALLTTELDRWQSGKAGLL